MEKYDLHSTYQKKQSYSYDDLINEIIKKYETTYAAFGYLPEDDWKIFIESKFKNDNRSGIIDKLYGIQIAFKTNIII